jgi:hypothetical protein
MADILGDVATADGTRVGRDFDSLMVLVAHRGSALRLCMVVEYAAVRVAVLSLPTNLRSEVMHRAWVMYFVYVYVLESRCMVLG